MKKCLVKLFPIMLSKTYNNIIMPTLQCNTTTSQLSFHNLIHQVVGHLEHRNLRTCQPRGTRDKRSFTAPYHSYAPVASMDWIWIGNTRKDRKTRRTLCSCWKVNNTFDWFLYCCRARKKYQKHRQWRVGFIYFNISIVCL